MRAAAVDPILVPTTVRGTSPLPVRLRRRGRGAVRPPSAGRWAACCPVWVYANRNRVERLWARLRERRAVAARYEKTARSFLGVLCLAAARDWLRR